MKNTIQHNFISNIIIIKNSNDSQFTDGVTDGFRNTGKPSRTPKNLLLT